MKGNHLIYIGCTRSGGGPAAARRSMPAGWRGARCPSLPGAQQSHARLGAARAPTKPGPTRSEPGPGSHAVARHHLRPGSKRLGHGPRPCGLPCPAVTRPAPRTHTHGSVAQRSATAATGLVSGDDWAGRLEVAVSPSAGPWPADAAVNAPQARAHPRRGPPIPDGGIVGPGSALALNQLRNITKHAVDYCCRNAGRFYDK